MGKIPLEIGNQWGDGSLARNWQAFIDEVLQGKSTH
jgi:hypothetical protein